MFRLISGILDKMGNWFGVVFKIIIPIVVMYYPTRLAVLSVYIYGIAYGGSYTTFEGLCEVMFWLLYLIFVAMAFLIPKVASIMEFIIIPYYMLTLIICANSSLIAMMVKNIDATVDFYVKVLPFALVFLAGKIMFYFFIRNNRAQIEIQRRRKFDEDNEYKEGPTIW